MVSANKVVADLRKMAETLDFTKRYLLRCAAETIENLQRDLAAREDIIDRQAIHTRHLANLSIADDEKITKLENEITMLKNERAIMAERIVQLEKENFWLTNGGQNED